MRKSKTLIAGLGVLVLAAAAAVWFSSWPPPAEGPARAAGTLTGVYCIDGWLDLVAPFPAKGQQHDETAIRSIKYLMRVEPSGGDWAVTTVAYTGPDTNGDGISDEPPSAQDCKTKGDGNQLDTRIKHDIWNDGTRPSSIATLSGGSLTWDVCSFESDRFGGVWVLTRFNLVIDKNVSTQDFGKQSAFLESPDDPPPNMCTDTPSNPIFSFSNIYIEATQRTATKGTPSPTLPDDWDGDGCSDWDELAVSFTGGGDPFNPLDCGTGIDQTSDIYTITNIRMIVDPAVADEITGMVTPGSYYDCIADQQPNPTAPDIRMRIYCYTDNTVNNVNNHSPGTGDGFAGPDPPAPYGEVHASHTELTGTIDNTTHVFTVTGCFGNLTTDPRGAPHNKLGYQYVSMTIDGDTGKGTADIHNNQADNCASSPTGSPQVASVHWAKEPKGYDHDRDNCSDKEELANDAVAPFGSEGQLRDPLNWGDFMSVHTGATLVKDQSVSIGDISAIVARFGSNDTGSGTFNRNSDPKSTPLPTSSTQRERYHPSYDRGGPIPNGNVAGSVSRQLPANAGTGAGSITIGDISAAVAQFGHNCVA